MKDWFKKFICFLKKRFVMKRVGGFTFVETLSVLAIGAVLSTGTVVSTTKLIELSKKTAARSQINQFSSALQSYFLDCGRFPKSEQGLNALWEKPSVYPVPDNWDGPYLEKKPGCDPWGSNYKYVSAESEKLPAGVPSQLPYVVVCFGADGQEDTKMINGIFENEGDDIVSWK